MIDEVWESLQEESGSSPGIFRRRIALGAPVDLYAAIEQPAGVPLLIMVVERSAFSGTFTAPDACGFELLALPAGTDQMEVHVRLLDPSGQSAFRALSEEILGRVGEAQTPRAALTALDACVRSWQEFFRRHGFAGLSPAAQQGLFGELWFLKETLCSRTSTEWAVRAWVGPTGANQDFQQGEAAYEVKTSTANPLRSVRISNLRQLDDTLLNRLRLVLIEADRQANSSTSLPDIVLQSRALICAEAAHVLERFNDLLHDAGYLDRDAAKYEDVGYAVRAVTAFVVSDGFPRLVETTVPAGVGNVSYSIALEVLEPFALTGLQLESELRELYGAAE